MKRLDRVTDSSLEMSLWMNLWLWMSMEDLVTRGESRCSTKSIHTERGFQLSASSRWVIDLTSSQACPRCSRLGRSPKFKRLGLPKPFHQVRSPSSRGTNMEESDHRSSFQIVSSSTHSKNSLSWVRPKLSNSKGLRTVAASQAARDPAYLEVGRIQTSRAWRKSKRCSSSILSSRISWIKKPSKMKFRSLTTSWLLAQVPIN